MKKMNEPDGDIKDNEPAGRRREPKVAGNTNPDGQSACDFDGNRDQRHDYYEEASGAHSLNELIQWIDDQKARNHIFQKREGLNTLRDWHMDAKSNFSHRGGKFFTVVGIRVTLPHREVAAWDQPIINNVETGIIGLLTAEFKGKVHVLMQAKAEVGNRHIIQLAPTVQFAPGNYINTGALKKPFLFDEFVSPSQFPVILESRQSEEGGRFYKEDHVHRVLLLPDTVTLNVPPDYRWLSLAQVRFFLHMGEQVNYCARSILACLL